jgi:biotin carboxyl carrier protein
MTVYELNSPDGTYEAEVSSEGEGYNVKLAESTFLLKLKRGATPEVLVVEVGGKPVSVTLVEATSQRVEMLMDGQRFSYQRPAAALNQPVASISVSGRTDMVAAPMPGKVMGAMVKAGEKVRAGDPLVVLESMKMEIAVRSERDAEIAEILVSEGDSVKRGQPLVRLVRAPS